MLSPASNPPNTSGREPVSVDASVLPTGAATSAKQDTANTSLAQLDVALSTRTKPSDQQHAIVDSSALPTGAATSAKQDTGNTSLANLDVALSTRATEATALLIKAKTDNLDVALSTRTKPADQQHAIVDSSALPTGAATSALQTTGNASLANLDVALSTRTKPSDQQHAIVDSSALPTGASTEATLALIRAKTDNLDVAISTRTKPADQQHAIVDSSALPTGASTSALQTTGNTSLANLDVALSTRTKPADQQHAIVDSSALPTGAATDTTVAAVTTSLGTDGATPPIIPGTGVRGWLRACYDKLVLLVAVFPVTFDTNSGNKSASTLRVVLATDQPTNTNKLAVTATSDQTTHGTTDLAADDIIKWNGVALSSPVATAPDGTQTAPVFRGLNRKFTTIETTTPLAGAATFTGAWHDSNLTGDSYVVATSLSNIIGANFFIEESDDTNNASFTRTVATWNGAPAANTLSYMVGVLRTRWWRVRYVNGATLQTTFELTTCAQTTCPDSVITNNTSGTNSLQVKQVQCVLPGGAGGMTDNLALFMTWTAQNAAGQGPQDCMVRFHGGKWSGTAAATKSGASGARTPTAFHQATATASGDTALWTPLTGNKFRVLRFKVQLTADAATSGGARITILLRDATTDIGVGHVVFVPSSGATALNAGYDSGWVDLGQFGYQSTAANAVLNINLSAALTAGVCNVMVAGTEE